jgi:hypothetical protein
MYSSSDQPDSWGVLRFWVGRLFHRRCAPASEFLNHAQNALAALCRRKRVGVVQAGAVNDAVVRLIRYLRIAAENHSRVCIEASRHSLSDAAAVGNKPATRPKPLLV